MNMDATATTHTTESKMSNETTTYAIFHRHGELAASGATAATVLDYYTTEDEDENIAIESDGRSDDELLALSWGDVSSLCMQAYEFDVETRLGAMARAMNNPSDAKSDWYWNANRFAARLHLDIDEDRTEAEPAGDTVWFKGGLSLALSAGEWCVSEPETPTYEIDAAMMGAAWGDNDDLDSYATILQDVVGDSSDIVAVTSAHNGASNEDPDLVTEAQWALAAGRYGAAMVEVETMPAYLRASHEAAGNSGRWPGNGATRSKMSRDDALGAIEADPEWTSIV